MNNVYSFYEKKGWNINNKITKDSELFEDNRAVAKEYLKKCRLKILKFIPKKGLNFLDFASGPIQYKEYLKYSKNYNYRHCIDFSKAAIRDAKKKLRNRGKYYCKDFMKINFKKNYFDCILSMHTIYHINKNQQEKVVRKLIKICKPNKPIIIVYSNPKPLIKFFYKLFIKKKKKKLLYFYCHPLEWWKRFENETNIEFYCWRSFSSEHQKIIFPNNIIGSVLFKKLFFLENFFNTLFARYFQYPIIVLKKK
tara:strand:- start:380 stop:1135 length:756 start_codon:yes stop_codon:yes gene_type:complete